MFWHKAMLTEDIGHEGVMTIIWDLSLSLLSQTAPVSQTLWGSRRRHCSWPSGRTWLTLDGWRLGKAWMSFIKGNYTILTPQCPLSLWGVACSSSVPVLHFVSYLFSVKHWPFYQSMWTSRNRSGVVWFRLKRWAFLKVGASVLLLAPRSFRYRSITSTTQ